MVLRPRTPAPRRLSTCSTRPRRLRLLLEVVAFAAIACLTAYSAVLAKHSATPAPLAEFTRVPTEPAFRELNPVHTQQPPSPDRPASSLPDLSLAVAALASSSPAPAPTSHAAAFAHDENIRWFNGRPVRPAKTMRMRVTAYSPDWRSCGDSADGLTATLHSVDTNNSQLVAADPRVLPYGSMVTVPGYAQGSIVPVLDCGGAIKGSRLDLLYPTHAQARAWGTRWLTVTVWEYADGKPATNPRKAR